MIVKHKINGYRSYLILIYQLGVNMKLTLTQLIVKITLTTNN
jgi:hypothetical protein